MSRLLIVLLAGSVCCIAESPVEGTLKALLAEMREMRLSLERAALYTSRLQMTMQRMQFQQQEVKQLSQLVESLREQLVRFGAQETEAQPRLPEGIPSEQRKQIEEDMKRARAHMEMEKERLRAQEVEYSARLRSEQGKLQELQDRLDGIDKLLEAAGRK